MSADAIKRGAMRLFAADPAAPAAFWHELTEADQARYATLAAALIEHDQAPARLPFPAPAAFGQAVANAVVAGFIHRRDDGAAWEGDHPALGRLTIARDRFAAEDKAQ